MRSARTNMSGPIFIVGLPRSGSTLWAKTLGSHPDIASFTEVHFLSLWHRDFRYILKHRVGDLSQERNVEKLLDIIFSEQHIIQPRNSIWFWNQIRNLEEKGLRASILKRIMATDQRGIGALFKIIVEEATYCQGRNRAVVKFPVYPTYLARLVRWWPESRIVHISRDPRALAASKTNDPGGVARLSGRYPWAKRMLPFVYKYFAVFQYILTSHVHSRFAGLPNYRLFFYEDLLNQPEKIVRELCEFCELEFNDSMLNPSAGQASSITGQKANGFDPSRADAWRKMLSPRESKFIELLTRPSMRRFGYRPGI